MVAERLSWLPAPGKGEPITFGVDGSQGFQLARWAPGANEASPLAVKGPRQMGQSPIGSLVQPTTHALRVHVLGKTHEEHAALRAKLAKALSVDTLARTPLSQYGTLRIERPGLPTLQTLALPQASPTWGSRRAGFGEADLEFWAPSPLWEALESRSLTLSNSAGVDYPLDYPLDYEPAQLAADLENLGDVSVGVMLRIFGQIEDPQITLQETGETLAITGTIQEGETLEVFTDFGEKKVELVKPNGSRENAFHRVALDQSTFFRVPPGDSTLTLDFATLTGGTASVVWREKYGGV